MKPHSTGRLGSGHAEEREREREGSWSCDECVAGISEKEIEKV